MDHVDPLVDLILDGLRVQKNSKDITLHLHLGDDAVSLKKTENPKKRQGS
jgi:hypothetical protein